MKLVRDLLKYVLVLSFAAPAFAEDRDEQPDAVTVRAFTHAGSGCPAGTVQGNYQISDAAFLILWDSFTAEAGPDVPLREARKNCQVNLDLEYTPGFQYTIESVEYNGKVNVQDTTQALAGSSYYFQGDDATITFNTLFDGPTHRRFRINDITDPVDQVWSTCDATRSLNVNFQVRINNAASTDPVGTISFGAGQTAGTLLKLKWRRCAE